MSRFEHTVFVLVLLIGGCLIFLGSQERMLENRPTVEQVAETFFRDIDSQVAEIEAWRAGAQDGDSYNRALIHPVKYDVRTKQNLFCERVAAYLALHIEQPDWARYQVRIGITVLDGKTRQDIPALCQHPYLQIVKNPRT